MSTNRATLELFAALDRSRPEPLRAQLEDAICAAITGGGLPPGTRLPASRSLAESLHVSRGVVSEAYAQIAAEGWIEVRHGAAPVVRAVPANIKRDSPSLCSEPLPTPRLDLTATAPDLSAFPRRAWAAALRKVLAEMPDAALDYGDPRGDDELRRELAAYLVRVRGAAANAEDLVITSGYTQGLWLACRALARRGATRVAVEDPSLDDSWATIRSAGLEVVGVPVDRHGIDPSRLDADAVLVTPAHQFPTGAVLSPERRRALLAWGGIVLEDDYDSEYRYDRAPVGTLQRLAPDRVVYLGTASKTLAPALRLGLAARAQGPDRGDRAGTVGGGLRRTGDQCPRLRATDRHAARSTGICDAPAASTASAATRWSRRSPSDSRAARSTAWPPACTSCCGCRRARTRTRWWPTSPPAASASTG